METREDTSNRTQAQPLEPLSNEELDEQLERLRNDPSVYIQQRTNFTPFEPWLSVTGPVSLRKLMGRDDYDEGDDEVNGARAMAD